MLCRTVKSSFEFGRLRENVLAASVALEGGEIREMPDAELGSISEARDGAGIVVGAKLRTRRADARGAVTILEIRQFNGIIHTV